MTIQRTYTYDAEDQRLVITYRVRPDIEIIRAINGSGKDVDLSQDEHDDVMCRIEEIEQDQAAERSVKMGAL